MSISVARIVRPTRSGDLRARARYLI